MPIMDGYKASALIKRFLRMRKAKMPIILACTGHLEDEFIEKAWLNQMDEIIPKPMNIDLVEAILKNVINFEI